VSTEQIAIVSGAAVGIAGVFAPTITAWFDRKHQRALAQAERRHTRRSQAYAEAGALLERERLFVLRTEPFIGPLPSPPAPLSDDEATRLGGSIAVASSLEARRAINEAHHRTSLFVARRSPTNTRG
jgi:hypothetical protein